MTALAVTKLDVLAGIDPLRVCVRYRHPDGAVFDEFPYHQSIIHAAEPEYEEMPGFEERDRRLPPRGGPPAGGARLPRGRQRLPRDPGRAWSGVGPGRDQVIWMGKEAEPRLRAAA